MVKINIQQGIKRKQTKKSPIKFSDDGSKFVSVDKRFLKKESQGYYLIYGGLIHYFDKNKNYETSKFI